jgi:hypothetical protein
LEVGLVVERDFLRDSVGGGELPWRPRAQEWDAGEYLSELSRSDLQFANENLSELEDFLWFDLCAEHDSRHLHAYLQGLPIPYTDDFRAFERLWFRDEVNHEKGFRRLYQLVSSTDDSDLDARLAKRVPDFTPFQDFVQDELSLCVVFAYDELATCHAYRGDLPLYRRLNSEVLPRWLQHIILDEAYHHRNALEIVVRHYGDRREEVARIIDRCVEYDMRQPPYRGTFIFDHEWEGVGPEFFRSNGARVMDLFDRAFTCS